MTSYYTMTKLTDLQGSVIEEGTGRTVAVTYDPHDAALLAAAPQMLDALQNVYANLGNLSDHGAERIDDSRRRIRAAIAAATPDA